MMMVMMIRSDYACPAYDREHNLDPTPPCTQLSPRPRGRRAASCRVFGRVTVVSTVANVVDAEIISHHKDDVRGRVVAICRGGEYEVRRDMGHGGSYSI